MAKKLYQTSLFIFRRDLRLHDNSALLHALESSKTVISCFIFDPMQVSSKNKYRSENAIQFMHESLSDLSDAFKERGGKLYLFQGKPDDIVRSLHSIKHFDALFINRDYTPYSFKRDNRLEDLCRKLKIAFKSYDDLMLNPPDAVVTQTGKPYTIFTPYFKRARKNSVITPRVNKHTHYYKHELSGAIKLNAFEISINKNIALHGGRASGLKILKKIKGFSAYSATRDIPELETTHLSAHNKFGTLSIREIYYAIADALGAMHPLIRQLYWRDFYMQIAFYYPQVFGHAFQKKYDALTWENNQKKFEAWCNGKTGFPIVDAGMRQLNQTGFMHNRVRMVVASFLVKDLHINWQWGERYFAQKLVDYDPAVNNGNWQWAASTGCDPQPYFRIFNPWLQQKKFDPQSLYIYTWVPELRNYPSKVIHNFYKYTEAIPGYPKPMVDHAVESKLAKSYFKALR